MTGQLDPEGASALLFKATINSATLPTIASTSAVPNGKTWIAHGICKLVEAPVYAVVTASSTAIAAATGIAQAGTSSGTTSAADSGTAGGAYCQCNYYTCARYCAHYCARYCAHYCGAAGYGYGHGYGYGFGFGYGYGTARGFSGQCTAIGVNGSTSWTQVVPAGFTVTTWLYYEEQAN